MARLGGNWGLPKHNNDSRTTIRTYPVVARMSLAEMKDRPAPPQPFRATDHYGSTISLKSLTTESPGSVALKCLDYNGTSLISLHDPEVPQMRRRSPSLPPIHNRDQQQYSKVPEDQQRDLGVEGLRYYPLKQQKLSQHRRRSCDRGEDRKENHYGSPIEERGGETSGYASDSVDVPAGSVTRDMPDCKQLGGETSEKTWQNPYYTTPESSLPPSRRLSDSRVGELNRPRWGSVWGQETARGDPPPPSWLARLGHTSQVLVINHDSASSPDSSTTGSTGSDARTYLRGQNIPLDAEMVQEREIKRQKALELQNAIKKQLEERNRQKREEKERRIREEQLEEERIKREQEREKERFQEEQRKVKEREAAKMKQADAMREVLEAAERLAKEEKKIRRRRNEPERNDTDTYSKTKPIEPKVSVDNVCEETYVKDEEQLIVTSVNDDSDAKTEKEITEEKETNTNLEKTELSRQNTRDVKPLQVPISKDVAIVLSGRLDDSEMFNRTNLQLVNFVVSPSPRRFDNPSNSLAVGINAVVQNLASPILPRNSSGLSPTIVENRLLTPSKYRASNARDFGTQTDVESDLQDLRERMQSLTLKENSMKERKDTTNTGRRDAEKSTNVGIGEDSPVKIAPRSKSQPRTSIDSRPRWNANRPGTRYRTQSEKDPHYQRRMRLRRRQVESSDERSRSPSPDRRKLSNVKSKIRNNNRHNVRIDHYDADLSMDSLNSIIPLRIDKNGRINLEQTNNKCGQNEANESTGNWCGHEILSKLSSLKTV